MDIREQWEAIKAVFEAAGASSLHVAMATVGADGAPHVTPIGSLILRDDYTGFYFEEFPVALSDNLDQRSRVSILALNSDANFWLESLSAGKFNTLPGVRLSGRSLGTRQATVEEVEAWQQRVSFAEGLKGHDILWKDMRMIRELQFDDVKPVLCGEMTTHLV